MNRPINQLSDIFLDRVDRLLNEYLDFFVDERETLPILSSQLLEKDRSLCNRKNMIGHLTASGLLIHPNNDSVFLIYHNFLKTWLQPGGHLDPEELPVHGALREFTEETGMTNLVFHKWHDRHPIPIDIDTHFIPENKNKEEGEHFHHDFQYLLSLKNDRDHLVFDHFQPYFSSYSPINIAKDEVTQYRWMPIAELMESDFDPRLKRVIRKISGVL